MNKLREKLKDQKSRLGIMTWILMISVVILLVPMSLLNQLGMASLVAACHPYIYIIAFISGFFIFKYWAIKLFDFCVVKIECRQKISSRINMIKCLDFEEKAILREFIIQKKNVLSLPLTEPAVTNLLSAGVLEPAFETQEIKGSSRQIKLSIALEARRKLTYIVLGLPAGKLTDGQATTLKLARPSYARTNYIALRD